MIARFAFLPFAIMSLVFAAQAQIQFAPAVEYNLNAPDATGSSTPALAIADFNKDGRPDVATNFDASVVVVLNKGDGTFSTPVPYSIPGSRTGGVVSADFNRDGYPDLAVLSVSPGVLRVRFNGGDGTFGRFTDYPLHGGNVFGGNIAVGDFDGDGHPDIAVQYDDYYGGTGNNVQIFHSNADGSLTAGTPLASPSSYGMYSADLNGDGLADLYFTYEEPGMSVLLNQGNGKFITQNYPVGGNIQWVAVDTKGNGKPDLFGADNNSYAPASFLQLPNNGNGTFGSLSHIYTGLPWSPVPLAAGDIDGDGTIDVVAMGVADRDPSLVVLPNLAGTLGTPQAFATGTEKLGSAMIGLGDFDGDGRLDIVLVNAHQNPSGAEMYIIRNTTPGSGPPPSIIGVFPPQGGNAGTLSSIEITGNGFPQNVVVKLVGPGPDIIPTNVIVSAAGNLITGSFNLVGTSPGSYTLVLTGPDGNVLLTKPAAFTVIQGGAPQLWVDVVGRAVLRAGFDQTYYLLVGNRGTLDSVSEPVWLALNDPLSLGTTGTQPSGTVHAGSETLAIFDIQSSIPVGQTVTVPVSIRVVDNLAYAHKTYKIWAGILQ